MNDIGAAGNAVEGRRRIWVPLAVIGVLLALIGAEAVFARSQPGGVRVVPDTVIEFGQGATVQAGEGWALDSAAGDLHTRLVFVREGVIVELTSVTFPGRTTPDEMWEGMDRLLDIERHQGVEVMLGSPSEYENASGLAGLQGELRIGERTGQAFALPDAEGLRAVEAQVLSSGASDEARSVAAALIDSIAFEESS